MHRTWNCIRSIEVQRGKANFRNWYRRIILSKERTRAVCKSRYHHTGIFLGDFYAVLHRLFTTLFNITEGQLKICIQQDDERDISSIFPRLVGGSIVGYKVERCCFWAVSKIVTSASGINFSPCNFYLRPANRSNFSPDCFHWKIKPFKRMIIFRPKSNNSWFI